MFTVLETKNIGTKLFLFSFIQGTVNGIWSFLSIYLLDLGGSGVEVGVLAMASGLTSTVMQLAWGRIGDRIGHTWRMVSTGFFFTALMSVPIILSNQPTHVIIFASIQTFLGSVSGIAITVRLSEILEPTKRGSFMGIYNPVGFTGNIVGSFFAGFLIPTLGYQYTFMGYTLLNLSIFGLIRYGISGGAEPRFQYHQFILRSFKELSAGLKSLPQTAKNGGKYTSWALGLSVRGFGIAMFGPVLTLYLVNVIGATKPQIGFLNSLAFSVRLVGSPILGRIVDSWGAKRIMLMGFILASIHPLTLIFVGEIKHLIPVFLLSGLYWAFINSSWFAWQMKLIPTPKGEYAAFFSFINGLAWAFGPLLGGFLGDYIGIGFTSMVSATTVVIGLLLMLRIPES